MKRILLVLILGAIVSCNIGRAQTAPRSLRFNNVVYTPQKNADSFISNKKSATVQAAQGEDKASYVVMQFSQLPTKEEIANYRTQGIQLVQYIENNTYFAKVEPLTGNRKYKGLDKLYAVFETGNLNKIDARIRENKVPDYALASDGKLKLTVTVFNTITRQEIKNALRGIPHEKLVVSELFHYFEAEVSKENLQAIADLPWVISIALRDAKFVSYDTRNSSVNAKNLYIYRHPDQSPVLNGAGVIVGLFDGNVEAHPDMNGRLIIEQNFSPDYSSDHGMHTMGILAGAGIKDPSGVGMATGATIKAYNYNWDDAHADTIPPLPELIYRAYKEQGIRISSNSYGPGINITPVPKFEYSARSANFDNLSNLAPDMLNVFAAGNSGAADNLWSTTPYAMKNTLLVANIAETGAVSTSSSRGPTMSGAIIPQVAAIGEGVYSLSFNNAYTIKNGTSMACPQVSGLAALVYQRYKEINKATPISSLAKAFICNGANDISIPGPDYATGFGEINTVGTMEMVDNSQFFVGSLQNTGNKAEYTIEIPEGVYEAKIMLAWNDPYAIPEAVGNTLINNLDLEVQYDRTYLPLVPDPMDPTKPAVEKVDNLNNMLQVVIKNPAKGKARIIVKGTAIPQPGQQYAVVYHFTKKGLTLLTPIKGDHVKAGESLLFKWTSVGLTGPVTIERSYDGGLTYSKTVVSSGNGYRFAMANDFTANAKYRLAQDGYFVESEGFPVIAQVKNLTLTSNGSSGTLTWPAATPTATQYQVLKYNESTKVYDVLATTSNNYYALNGDIHTGAAWFAVRAKNGNALGERSIAVKFEGTTASSSLPLHIDFNNGVPGNIRLSDGQLSNVRLQYIPAHQANVLQFMGAHEYSAATTSVYSQEFKPAASMGNDATLNTAFTINSKFVSSAGLKVDLPADKRYILRMKVRVLSSLPVLSDGLAQKDLDGYPHHSLFRVRAKQGATTTALKEVSGKIVQTRPFVDTKNSNYNYSPLNIRVIPESDEIVFVNKYYDLSAYAGSSIDLSFEAMCATLRWYTNVDPEGSQVYIKEIHIEEQKPYELVVTGIDSIRYGGVGNQKATFTNILSYNHLTSAPLVDGGVSKEVFAQVANIGYNATDGSVKMDIARRRLGDTLHVTQNVPTVPSFGYKFVNMGAVKFVRPESHDLYFSAKASSSTVTSDISYAEYCVDNYESSSVTWRVAPAGYSNVQYPGDDGTMNFSDGGSNLYPYLRLYGYNYPVTVVPKDGSQRMQLTFSEVDLVPGDVIKISSGGKLLGSLTDQDKGGTYTSTAGDGSLTFNLEINIDQNSSTYTNHRGWYGKFTTVKKTVGKEVGIVNPGFSRPDKFSDGYGVALIIQNQGSVTVRMQDFSPSYQFGNLAKVKESSNFHAYNPVSQQRSSTKITELEPGKYAHMYFAKNLVGTNEMINNIYNVTFRLEDLTDTDTTNNKMVIKFMYGDGAQANDFGPNAFVKYFDMAGVTRSIESSDYGYMDFTRQVIKVELGKGYPYKVILDGRQAKILNAAFITDTNSNAVFENIEVMTLDNNGTENNYIYEGVFWPHTFFTKTGDYRFRVAAFQDGNMSAWEFTLRVSGTPVDQDVELRKVTLKDNQLTASSIAEAEMDILCTNYPGGTPATLGVKYENAEKATVYEDIVNIDNLLPGRQTRTVNIPVPTGVDAGNYTLVLTLNTNDPVKQNNSQTQEVSIKTDIVLYTTSKRGRIQYVSPISNPAAASRLQTKLPAFGVSNCNDAAWVIDTTGGKNINTVYMLSEQYASAFLGETFYHNQLVYFSFDNAIQQGSYTALPNNFDGSKIHAIAFNPKSKTLYGLGADSRGYAQVYRIDHVTGAATAGRILTGNIPAGELSGLAVDLNDNLYTVRNSTDVYRLIPATGAMEKIAKISSAIPAGNRVNMAYYNADGTIIIAFQNSSNVGQVIKVDLEDKNTEVISDMGSYNQSYSLALTATSNPAVDTLFRLDHFVMNGQDNSCIDNIHKTINIIIAPGSNKATLSLNNYSFANGNGTFTMKGSALNPGQVINLSSAVTLTATHNSGRTATWTLSAEDPVTNGARIISYKFLKANNPELTADVTAVIAGDSIKATVAGVENLQALIPTIVSNIPVAAEKLYVGIDRIYSDRTPIDFSAPVLLALTSDLLQVQQLYRVKISRAQNNGNALIDFGFYTKENPSMDKDAPMVVDHNVRSITIPHGVTHNLVPHYTVSHNARLIYNGKVITSAYDTMSVAPGTITVIVQAENGDEQAYSILIKEESVDAKLVSFNILAVNNHGLSKDIHGTIDESGQQVNLIFPEGANKVALIPAFRVSENAALYDAASGVRINEGDIMDFRTPFFVEVLNNNGVTTTTYKVLPVTQGEQSITASPNPAITHTTLMGVTPGKTAAVYDTKGRLLMTVDITSETQRIDVSNLASGIYYVRTEVNGSLQTILLIKR